MENAERWVEKEEYQSYLGQERRPIFCIGTHFIEMSEYVSVRTKASSPLICTIMPPP